jgi:hypothetical protein
MGFILVEMVSLDCWMWCTMVSKSLACHAVSRAEDRGCYFLLISLVHVVISIPKLLNKKIKVFDKTGASSLLN